MNKKNILFLHQNFGQFKHLAPEMAKSKRYNVYSLSLDSSNTHSLDDLNNSLKDIKHYKYKIIKGNSEGTIRLAIEFETKMIRASAVLERALEVKEEGLEPDLLIIHPGWGEGFVLKEVWPNAKFLNYFLNFIITQKTQMLILT